MSHRICCAQMAAGNSWDGNIYKLHPDPGPSCQADKADAEMRCHAEGCPDNAVVALVVDEEEPCGLCWRHWETHRSGSIVWVFLHPIRAGDDEDIDAAIHGAVDA